MHSEQQHADVLPMLGAALVAAQALEKRLTLLLSIGRPKTTTLDQLQAQPKEKRKRMLGELFSDLKKQGPLVPELVSDLDSFLDDRNKLAHNLPSLIQWDLRTVEGRVATCKHLQEFIRRAQELSQVFDGALGAWEYHFNAVSQTPAFETWLNHVSLIYGPLFDEWRHHRGTYTSESSRTLRVLRLENRCALCSRLIRGVRPH